MHRQGQAAHGQALQSGPASSILYLAVALDAFSRGIVGWSMATTLPSYVAMARLPVGPPRGLRAGRGLSPWTRSLAMHQFCGLESQQRGQGETSRNVCDSGSFRHKQASRAFRLV